MAGELYINSRLVDIDQSIPFPLTFNISDIKDISSRKGNKSKTITLPGTRVNHQLMTSVFLLTSTEKISTTTSGLINFDPSIKAPCQYYENGLLQFNGIAQLMECKLNNGTWSFEITMVSDTIDYIAQLKKVKVNELDYSEYEHNLTLADQQETWNGFNQINGVSTSIKTGLDWNGEGYYYGLIDYGYSRPTPDTFAVDNIPVQTFVYGILKKIFEFAGITWSSNFLESQRFKRLLLAYYGGALPTITAGDSLNDSATTTENNNAGGFIINGTTASEYYQGTQDTFLPAANFYDNYDATIVTDPSSQVITNNPLKFRAASTGLFQVTYSGTQDIDFSFMTGVTLYCDYSVILMTKKNNVLIGNDVIYSGLLNMGIMPVATVSFTFTTSQAINMSINDELTFEIRLDRNQGQIFGAPFAPISFTQTVTSTGVSLDIIKSQQALTPGSTINLNPFLPDMTCDVFLKGIITAFNLYLKPDANNPTILEIEPLADFYNGSDKALDWTYLVDKSKEIKVIPTINFASKDYNFMFEKEDDYWNTQYINAFAEQYGSFTLSSQSQYATDTTDMKLPFGQHPLALIDSTNLIVPRFYQVNFDEFGNGQIVLKKGKSFIVQLGEMRAGNWIHRNESGIDIPQIIYPYVGHLDDIDNPTFDFNFGVPEVVYYPATIYTSNNLFEYHETFIKEIVSRFGKMLTLYATIDSDTINKLDFRNLINIDAVVYRLQKINDYDSGKGQSTLIELIRIIEGESAGTIIPPSYRITENGIVRREENNTNQRIIE
jgi:hypothetical protein